MALSIHDQVTLNNGTTMPRFGLGVFQAKAGGETAQAVRWAFEAGYRHVDTAALYGNEEDVGRAVIASGIPRNEIFVTSKVWNEDLRRGRVREAFETTMEKLGLATVDLFLIHWPVPGKFIEAWHVLEELYDDGRIRAIGVSNFLEHHLEALLAEARVVPAVNQVEWHPWLQQPALMDACRARGIVFQAWSPLMQGRVVEVPELVELGRKHGKSAAQIAIRWGLQREVVMIPKSVRRERIIENAAVFDFELSEEEVSVINGLDRGHRFGADPDDFDF